MKSILLSLILLSPIAQAETVQVQGQEMEALNVSRFDDGSIHHFDLAAPAILPFAPANSLAVKETVYLYQGSTDVSLAASAATETQRWKLPGGQEITLDCRPKKNSWGELVPRLVSFFPGQRYHRGCLLGAAATFTTGGTTLQVKGEIDLSPEQGLEYASELVSGALVTTPEPATVALVGLGLAGVAVVARRRRA